MTDECNLPEGFEVGAAFRIGTGIDDIKRFIAEFGAAEPSELKAIGARGRALVVERFAWSDVARRMAAVYRWLIGDGERPDFAVDRVP